MESITLLTESLTKNFQPDEFKNLLTIMNKYNGSDWKKFVKYTSDNYNKIPLFENNYFDLYLVCWDKLQGSPIHDHSPTGCILKVLAGELVEELYCPIKINLQQKTTFKTGSCSYIDNSLAVHRVANLHKTHAVSLHLYSPPGYQHKTYSETKKN